MRNRRSAFRPIAAATAAALLLAQPLAARPAPLGSCCPEPPAGEPHRARLNQDVVAFLERLQDSQPSGLVPIVLGSTFTTAYSNAAAAIALTAAGRFARVRRILDNFDRPSDPCPDPDFGTGTCACPGGFQQHRNAATGGREVGRNPNDFWVGDNAWLLAAARTYRARTGDHRYDALIDRLGAWLVCLEAQTPDPGILGGYRNDGGTIPPHPEGSIDVVGSLRGLTARPIVAARESAKAWIDGNVWVRNGECFDVGPVNASPESKNLPNDNVSWGYLALGPEYCCLLRHAEALTARTQDRYLVEIYDRDGLWSADRQNATVTLARERRAETSALAIRYEWTGTDAWWRAHRERDIDLEVSAEFRYFFWLEGNAPPGGRTGRFEVKFSAVPNDPGATCFASFDLDFSGWRRMEVRYGDLGKFAGGGPCELTRWRQIEFALNRAGAPDTGPTELRLGRIWYEDCRRPRLLAADGFDGFETESNWLFVEGTGQMAAAYCAAGEHDEWRRYLGELEALLVDVPKAPGGRPVRGLPNFLTGGVNRPVPESVASSWLLIAEACVSPFDP